MLDSTTSAAYPVFAGNTDDGIQLTVYVMHIENPKEILLGAKPRMLVQYTTSLPW